MKKQKPKKDQKLNLRQIFVDLLKKYKNSIKSVLIEGNSVVVLVSDKKQEIKKYSEQKNYKVDVKNMEEYLKHLFAGEKVVYEKITDAKILYDPEHFIDPLQEMVFSGKIQGTKEDIMTKFISINEKFKKIEMIKHKILDNIYTSVVEMSQALLMAKKDIICKPKETLKFIEKCFVSKNILEKKYHDIAKLIITTYKDIEHKKRSMVSGREIDFLQKKAEEYQNRVLELLG